MEQAWGKPRKWLAQCPSSLTDSQGHRNIAKLGMWQLPKQLSGSGKLKSGWEGGANASRLPSHNHCITGIREDRPHKPFAVTEIKRQNFETQKCNHRAYLWPCTFQDTTVLESSAIFYGCHFWTAHTQESKINWSAYWEEEMQIVTLWCGVNFKWMYPQRKVHDRRSKRSPSKVTGNITEPTQKYMLSLDLSPTPSRCSFSEPNYYTQSAKLVWIQPREKKHKKNMESLHTLWRLISKLGTEGCLCWALELLREAQFIQRLFKFFFIEFIRMKINCWLL